MTVPDATPPFVDRPMTEADIPAVLAMEVDMGLIEGSSHWAGLAVQRWMQDELVIVAAPQDPLCQAARDKPLGVAVLRQTEKLLA